MNDSRSDFIFKNFLKIATAIIIIIAFLFILSPFLISLLLGGVLAMAFSPFLQFFTDRGWSRRLSVLFISVAIFILGLAPVTIVLMRGTKFVTNFFDQQSLALTKAKIEDKVYMVLDNLAEIYSIDPIEIQDRFEKLMSSVGSGVVSVASNLLSQIPNLAMLVFITILSFYFFLMDEDKIRAWFDRYFHFGKGNGEKFIRLIKSSCYEIFFSNVITGLIQASIITLGAFFTRAGDVFIIFFSAFFFSFIPVIGAAPVGFIVAAFAFIDNRPGDGIVMSVVSILAGLADNIVRPYLSSRGAIKVPVYASFLSIIGGVILMGLPGLFLGPLLASLAYGALPIIIDEFFDETNKEPTSSE